MMRKLDRRDMSLTRAAAAALLVALLAGCARPEPQAAGLAIPVNPLCTVCDDFLRCEAAGAGQDDYRVLHLQNKTFVAQLATILDFLLQYVRERKEDVRPLAIYFSAGGPARTGVEAVTDLVRHRIAVPDGWIDQADGAWHGSDGAVLGQCRVLPLPEGRELVKNLRAAAPGPAQGGGG